MKRKGPSECEPIRDDGDNRPFIDIITSDSLLATVLSPAWRHAHSLMRVCKRFYAAAKRAEFWMPAVRRTLALRIPTMSSDLRAYINPFFRFPADMPACPDLPWWAFLTWLFTNSSLGSYAIREQNFNGRGIIYRDYVLVFSVSDNGTRRRTQLMSRDKSTNGYHWLSCGKYEEPGGSGMFTGLSVIVNGKPIWADYVRPGGGGRHWVGLVCHTNMGKIHPLENFGMYRE